MRIICFRVRERLHFRQKVSIPALFREESLTEKEYLNYLTEINMTANGLKDSFPEKELIHGKMEMYTQGNSTRMLLTVTANTNRKVELI